MKITFVAGARPNFMKIAPIIHELHRKQKQIDGITYRLVHTGQHFDRQMSTTFFEDLGIPHPDNNLKAGGGTQAEQTALIMIGFEKELIMNPPNVVVVVGDVTSTMACAITAKKMCLTVVHVEAGIRSGDMSMPEEVNRIVTDSITDHFFTTSEVANQHLIRSGAQTHQIHFVGNTMIDTLYQNLSRLKKPDFWNRHQLAEGGYFLMTLHRPANVDSPDQLLETLNIIMENNGGVPVVFPVHPRTKKIIETLNYKHELLLTTEPLGYLEFIYLIKHSKAIITDSGGITEEATALKIPCLTLRDSTERPETVTHGSNELVGVDALNLIPYLQKINRGTWKESTMPPLWDGRSAERIVSKLINLSFTENLEVNAVSVKQH
ncbi:MAG: UDP-N-acetylglucosamine 2-epimerase (non-hydrolyzing) [Chitinophagaceae bacterium]